MRGPTTSAIVGSLNGGYGESFNFARMSLCADAGGSQNVVILRIRRKFVCEV